jgi:hypothetical protein
LKSLPVPTPDTDFDISLILESLVYSSLIGIFGF